MNRLYGLTLLACCAITAGCNNDTSFNPQDPASVTVSGNLPATSTTGATVSPAVVVRDASGRPLAGVVVTFQITQGGGTIDRTTASTNGNGVASVSWTLGADPVVNTLIASVPALDPVIFDVTPCGVYCVEIRYVGTISAPLRAAFTNARIRWEQVIVGNLPSVQLNVGAGACKDSDGEALVDHPAINEVIDDLVVYVQIDSIDGPGGVLGSAGPCFIRNASRLPVLGVMRFDRADLLLMEQNGLLNDVILHELGHVLGFPTIWNDTQFNLLVGSGTDNPYFTGTNAVSRFQLAGGSPVNGVGVPVENTGGAGTRDAHWRESVLASELMTGFISSGNNPLSTVTIGSLADIGYTVDYGAADPYVVPSGGHTSGWSTLRLEMIELPMPAPRTVP
ncbi:MAG: hypothetical protein KFH98_13295 [Gemmatimonadetes bacterium]|nr:hypothetical protein [Gemmatimonadota bacterium]